MLHLHLQKSQTLLQGRLKFVRARLLGQPLPRASQLKTDTERAIRLRSKVDSLVHKYTKKDIKKQKSTVFAFPPKPEEKTDQPVVVVRKTKPLRTTIFSVLMSLSFALLLILFGPVIYFRFFTHETVPVQTTETGTVLGGDFVEPVQAQRQIAQPPREESLPEGNWLSISRIGVRTEILESEIPEESLIKGVWRVPEFGKPGDTSMPLILAAHRYGYNWWWKGEYWKYHSFYLLPELEPGDLVEVISDKRKYLYEIYAGEEGTDITDYNADLILYTCKFLNSDVRHFRYARLIDPSKYSDYVSVTTDPGS